MPGFNDAHMHPSSVAEDILNLDVSSDAVKSLSELTRKVLDQGLHPDGVSTDGHRGNRAGPVYDLPTTMAKLMALGFTLNRVVEMATANAAKLLGRAGELGTLKVGQPAEISVLRVEDREWTAIDSQKGAIPARQTVTPVFAIRGDQIYEPLAVERP